jgi:polysaccharide deacetylase 2 family uncharacterized protein YibQ
MAKKGNKTGKSKIPPALVVGGIFFLLFAIFFVLIVNVRIERLKKEQASIQNNKKTATQKNQGEQVLLDLDEKLKVFLFDHEVSKERLKTEKPLNSNNMYYYKYRMLLSEMEAYSIKPALINFFKNSSFNVRDNGTGLLCAHDNIIVEIEIEILEETKETPPPKEILPQKKIKPEVKPLEKISAKHRLAIILDDSGQNLDLADRVVKMKYPITLSVLPYTKHDRETVNLAKSMNKDVFLHLPMEPNSYPDTNPGKGAILMDMPPSLIESTINEDFNRLGDVDGVNNHMGSAYTENKEKMAEALLAISKHVSIFIDSHTTPGSVAFETCKSIGSLKCGINKKFIDNSADPEYIKNKLYEAARSLTNGDVIIIGHLRNSTVQVLNDVLPELEKQGVKITSVKELVGK